MDEYLEGFVNSRDEKKYCGQSVSNLAVLRSRGKKRPLGASARFLPLGDKRRAGG